MNSIQGPVSVDGLDFYWITEIIETIIYYGTGIDKAVRGTFSAPGNPEVFLNPIFRMQKTSKDTVRVKFQGRRTITPSQLNWINSHCLSELRL